MTDQSPKHILDRRRFPATAQARDLQMRCRCDDCGIDCRIAIPKHGVINGEVCKAEQKRRTIERTKLAPTARDWIEPSAHEISCADDENARARMLLWANFGCAHIREMVREHRDVGMAGPGLPDVDALEAQWVAEEREKWWAKKFQPRPKRRRIKKVLTPSSVVPRSSIDLK